MNYYSQPNPYESPVDIGTLPAALAETSARTTFIRRVYVHVFAAVLLFTGIEAAIFTLVPEETLRGTMGMLLGGRFGWLMVIGAFMAASWLAQSLANSESSKGMQYAGLMLYIVAQALIFVPLLYIAQRTAPGTIPAAGLLTLLIFGGLTMFVVLTKADFSGWGQYLWWAGIASIGVVVAAIFFNFQLGVWFAAAMVGLASVYILYDTSNILHRYRTDQYVAASLALFASITMLFYNILRLLMAFNRRD
ncbi:Inhibitor of apoptosis-promoting Bax1 [Anatilimnocola aggregata]|uniref:Inhibitor of apoptosis-promoting Bax1 n=1 Tax=Anatilimnocola aggregata TaxID=2528021 RepID=A0A517YNH8_9BACT|nr:Bax inhibitor-1 family protein [Anatilimnocola aggregata]QDU31778.1 Inhibitor of apoptosis-promoting Bax1 [Anatilimnocola aggregata]